MNVATFSLEAGALEHATSELQRARAAAGAEGDTALTLAIEFSTSVLELRRGSRECARLRARFEPFLETPEAEQMLAELQNQANVTRAERRCLGR